MYRVEIALHSLSIAMQSHLIQPHSIPLMAHSDGPKMVISIPGPILESVIPTLVQQFTGQVLPTTTPPDPVRFLLTVFEIWSDALQILPLHVPSSQQVRMDVGIPAHSSGVQAYNEDPASKDAVPEQDPEPASDPDFIDLTLSD